jgi:hypothetical protein
MRGGKRVWLTFHTGTHLLALGHAGVVLLAHTFLALRPTIRRRGRRGLGSSASGPGSLGRGTAGVGRKRPWAHVRHRMGIAHHGWHGHGPGRGIHGEVELSWSRTGHRVLRRHRSTAAAVGVWLITSVSVKRSGWLERRQRGMVSGGRSGKRLGSGRWWSSGLGRRILASSVNQSDPDSVLPGRLGRLGRMLDGNVAVRSGKGIGTNRVWRKWCCGSRSRGSRGNERAWTASCQVDEGIVGQGQYGTGLRLVLMLLMRVSMVRRGERTGVEMGTVELTL